MDQLILEYIDLVKSSVPNAEKVFTQGNCGSFARMLLFTFPDGRILYDQPNHFLFEFDKIIYDITGNVNGKYDYKKLIPLEKIGDINKIICELKPRYK